MRSQVDRFTRLNETGKFLERADDGTELWATDSGDWWVPTGSRSAMAFDLAEQDRDIYRTEPDGIGPGDVVLDCGANIGLFAAKALSRGAARVIAIEPAPNNLVALRKNLAKEIESGRVTIYPKGVWDKEDVLPMYLDPDNAAANSFLRDGDDELTVDLPSLVSGYGLGSEQQVTWNELVECGLRIYRFEFRGLVSALQGAPIDFEQ